MTSPSCMRRTTVCISRYTRSCCGSSALRKRNSGWALALFPVRIGNFPAQIIFNECRFVPRFPYDSRYTHARWKSRTIALPSRAWPPKDIAPCSPTDPPRDSVSNHAIGRRFAEFAPSRTASGTSSSRNLAITPARNGDALISRPCGIGWHRRARRGFARWTRRHSAHQKTNLLFSYLAGRRPSLSSAVCTTSAIARPRISTGTPRPKLIKPWRGASRLHAKIGGDFRSSAALHRQRLRPLQQFFRPFPQCRIHQQPPINPSDNTSGRPHLHKVIALG